MGRVTARRPVRRIATSGEVRRPDTLAVEEPMEIRVGGEPLTVTMRTPGHDVDLVHGFLLSEGLIGDRSDVSLVRYCDGADEDGANTYNVLDVTFAGATASGTGPPDAARFDHARRSFLTTSACGVCGKASLDAVRTRTRHPVDGDGWTMDSETLSGLPDKLRVEQRVFATTGGLHAAGLFTRSGEVLAVREDVGRHNAVDKVLGWAVREDLLPLSDTVLIVSGRASFELVQKAVMAGVPALGAVSAPSSLAVDLAEESGLTLVGFLRGDSMNVYTHPHRIR
jgi:FdhD protein